ncbi:MAG: hypothetical protein HY293_20950 [Planctomycetes bacterium]|nr:hypothetical protein [Planctomycetota bacterium]
MVPPEVSASRLDTRLNLVSRQVLLLLGERGEAELAGLGEALGVPEPFAHLSVGWLARSRVIDLIEDSSGRLRVRMRRPFE